MCNMLATTEHGITLQEDSVSLHQQFKIAGLWDSPGLVLWNGLSKQLK